MARHVLLVGLPGAGKTTVGRLAAEELGAPLIDVDALLVREMGMPVARIFGMVGEVRFRQLERDAVRTARARSACVIVPGGGWAAQPGQLEEAKADCLVLYLNCPAATAARRAAEGEVRPLLAGGNPGERMRQLLQVREPFYRQAHLEVDAGNRPAQVVAAEVVALARRHGGWPLPEGASQGRSAGM